MQFLSRVWHKTQWNNVQSSSNFYIILIHLWAILDNNWSIAYANCTYLYQENFSYRTKLYQLPIHFLYSIDKDNNNTINLDSKKPFKRLRNLYAFPLHSLHTFPNNPITDTPKLRKLSQEETRDFPRHPRKPSASHDPEGGSNFHTIETRSAECRSEIVSENCCISVHRGCAGPTRQLIGADVGRREPGIKAASDRFAIRFVITSARSEPTESGSAEPNAAARRIVTAAATSSTATTAVVLLLPRYSTSSLLVGSSQLRGDTPLSRANLGRNKTSANSAASWAVKSSRSAVGLAIRP